MFRFLYEEVLSIFIKNNYYDELNSISELFIAMITETRYGEAFVVIGNNLSQRGNAKCSRNPVICIHMHLFHSKVHQTHHRNKSYYGCSPEEVHKAKSEFV